MRTRSTIVAAMIVTVLVGCVTAPTRLELVQAADPDEIIFDDRAWEIGTPGGSLTVPTALGIPDASVDPVSLNPAAAAWDPAELPILNMLFVAPVDRDPLTGEWSPRLAESFELREGGKVFRIRLRDDLLWSDGTPLTVDDLVYSYRVLYADPTAGTLASGYLDRVGGIEVRWIDGRTYELETGIPHMLIWDLVSLPPLPKHVVEPWVEENGVERFVDFWSTFTGFANHVGNGPFMLADYTAGDRVRLVRNPHYYERDANGERLPYLDELVFLVRPGIDQIELFADGETDIARYTGHGFQRDPVAARPTEGHFIFASPYDGTIHLLFLNPRSSSPLRDRRFRAALAHLIDRDSLAAEVYGRLGIPMWFGEVPYSPYSFDARGRLPGYDPSTAARILAELGLRDRDGDGFLEDPEGNPLVLEFVTNEENPSRVEAATLIAATLQAAGIRSKLVAEPFGAVVSRFFETGDWEAVLLGYAPVPGVVPGMFDEVLPITRAGDARTDSFFEELAEIAAPLDFTVEQGELTRIYREAQLLVDAQHDQIWLHSSGMCYALSAPIRNLEPRAFDDYMLSYDRAFIDGPR